MATWDDVRAVAEGLPQVTQRPAWGNRMWRVKDKGFVWERPLNRADLARLGGSAPAPADAPILAVRVPDDGTKEALVADDRGIFFTIEHFDGYPAVLVRLDLIDVAELREVVVDAWLDRAPKRLSAAYLAEHPPQ